MAQRMLIMGAAGKDFHTFNCCFRDREQFNVVAFTATQIPDIAGRRYPAELAGRLYPEGIPILDEADLADIIRSRKVDRVVFAYSDVSYDYVHEREKIVTDAGASFDLAPVEETMLASSKPVIAVVAVRTGCGKSQTARRVVEILRAKGRKVVAVRHPMPYGDLLKQRVQRFATIDDLKKHDCTIEEMEEYEPHIAAGCVVYAGVDYEDILREAEQEADVVIWDGGNNDTPFYKPDMYLTLADPLRPGHELSYYPGKINFERAGVILLNKMDTASEADVQTVLDNAAKHNPKAIIVKANSPVTVQDASIIEGKRVLVIEDGPTCTHGGMKIGAATVAARRHNAAEIVDPRPYAVGSIAATYEKYPNIGMLLPAMGYGEDQVRDLEATIANADVDAVVVGTPIDLTRIVKIDKPNTRVTYDLEEIGSPNLEELLADF
jgi:predicted GTPase